VLRSLCHCDRLFSFLKFEFVLTVLEWYLRTVQGMNLFKKNGGYEDLVKTKREVLRHEVSEPLC
jgi:hypothetical protein